MFSSCEYKVITKQSNFQIIKGGFYIRLPTTAALLLIMIIPDRSIIEFPLLIVSMSRPLVAIRIIATILIPSKPHLKVKLRIGRTVDGKSIGMLKIRRLSTTTVHSFANYTKGNYFQFFIVVKF